MMQYVNSMKGWLLSPQGALITGGTILSLTAIRLFASGGKCRASRDLSGKVIVITGANTGIGKETMKELSKQPCTIIFGARDARKSEEAIKQLKNKKAEVIFFPLDLADKNSIKEFSNRTKATVDKIDILINNAGVMMIPERRTTADGFEMQMGTNHLGHFYLTHLLWDRLKNAQEFRVINLSSKAHKGFGFPKKKDLGIDFEDFHYEKGYQPGIAYSRSKAANILFTRELQRRIDQAGLNGIAVSLHPGVVRTELSRYFSLPVQILKTLLQPLLYLVMKSPWEGAQTTLHVTLEKAENLKKGQYYSDCQVQKTTPFSSNLDNAERLWNISEKQLGIQFKI